MQAEDSVKSFHDGLVAHGLIVPAAVKGIFTLTTLEAQLKGEGLTVRQIKTEKGCYEVYAVGKDGKKVNAAYNAETLEKLDNAEAGEN